MANLILAVNSDVMQDPQLELLDKLILSYILNWEERNLSCFAKDGFLSQLFGVKESEILLSIYKLQGMGKIEQIVGTGGRLIKSIKSQTIPAPVQEIDIFNI